MKQLILVRHAKSDWTNPSLDDFDRPLNDRGRADAPMMAKRMLSREISIDAFIASPAKRAAKTAKAFAEAYGKKKSDIIFIEKLYHADIAAFLSAITATDNAHDTIAIFSHNFGITDFANTLTDTRIDNIPTCGIFAIKIEANDWTGFKEAPKEFWFFDFPKADAD